MSTIIVDALIKGIVGSVGITSYVTVEPFPVNFCNAIEVDPPPPPAICVQVDPSYPSNWLSVELYRSIPTEKVVLGAATPSNDQPASLSVVVPTGICMAPIPPNVGLSTITLPRTFVLLIHYSFIVFISMLNWLRVYLYLYQSNNHR